MEVTENMLRRLIASVSVEGKDMLTPEQSAHYLSVSVSKFYEIRRKYGLIPHDFEGKTVYRKADLKAIQQKNAKSWQDIGNGVKATRSTGTKVAKSASNH